MTPHSGSSPLVLHIGPEELVVRRRYEAASIANDILIALWFIVGSVMFFSESWTTPGTWCFLAGSIELLVRPVIRLGRQLHVQRVRSRTPAPPDVLAAESTVNAPAAESTASVPAAADTPQDY